MKPVMACHTLRETGHFSCVVNAALPKASCVVIVKVKCTMHSLTLDHKQMLELTAPWKGYGCTDSNHLISNSNFYFSFLLTRTSALCWPRWHFLAVASCLLLLHLLHGHLGVRHVLGIGLVQCNLIVKKNLITCPQLCTFGPILEPISSYFKYMFDWSSTHLCQKTCQQQMSTGTLLNVW